MASPEAETFLWRRILLDERVYSTNRAPGGCQRIEVITSQRNSLLTSVFTPQYLSSGCFIPTQQPGNASTPTKTYQALHCQAQTVSPKRETIRNEALSVKRGRETRRLRDAAIKIRRIFVSSCPRALLYGESARAFFVSLAIRAARRSAARSGKS
jgi:hypothetical protein